MPVTRTRRLRPPSIFTSTVSPSSTNTTFPVQTRHDGLRGFPGMQGARRAWAAAAGTSAIAQAASAVASVLSIRVTGRVTSASLRAAGAAPPEAARPRGGTRAPGGDATGRMAYTSAGATQAFRRRRGSDPHPARARVGGGEHHQDELQPRDPPVGAVGGRDRQRATVPEGALPVVPTRRDRHGA